MKIDWLDMRLLTVICASLISLWETLGMLLCSAFTSLPLWRSRRTKSEFWNSIDLCLWSPQMHFWMNKWEWKQKGAELSQGIQGSQDLKKRWKTYVHGNVPGHVDVRFVFIHPHLCSPQGIALSVVINVIVIGLLGALNVSHSGTWQDFHTSATLPYLGTRKITSLVVGCVLVNHWEHAFCRHKLETICFMSSPQDKIFFSWCQWVSLTSYYIVKEYCGVFYLLCQNLAEYCDIYLILLNNISKLSVKNMWIYFSKNKCHSTLRHGYLCKLLTFSFCVNCWKEIRHCWGQRSNMQLINVAQLFDKVQSWTSCKGSLPHFTA